MLIGFIKRNVHPKSKPINTNYNYDLAQPSVLKA
jgi:hypothetical protein